MAANKSVVVVPPPGLQECVGNSTTAWQTDLETLFTDAKARFPDVVWELDGSIEVWGHKAIVYARAPPSFQSRYFSFGPNRSLPYPPSPTDDHDHFPTESTASLDLPPSTTARSPSPASSLLRIATSINPTLFSNELEYLYTGQGFGEAFEFLFDSAGAEDGGEDLRLDKLRKDLVFMWRSRLYSDVRIALTSARDNTTAIFSSHRFVLVSRCPYFRTLLLDFGGTEPPTLSLPSPPFTPASLHFTLGYIYTGTLVFSHRSYDLSTAFAILRAALYLALTPLHDEIQARIAHEMLHGLFHAFLPFPEYEALTQGRWGTGGCRCRQCARRVPRVLEFSLADDVRNPHLERGARRALVGMFGEGWCTAEFAGLPVKLRESLLKGVSKRTTPMNAFPLLFAAEHALVKLGSLVEPWADTVGEMLGVARRAVDELIAKESEACFSSDEWVAILESESEGGRFGDVEKAEWAMASVLRGVREPWAAMLYQTLVSGILLRPHPTEEREPLLSAASQLRVVVEETRLELLKWIGRKWITVRQEQGFDNLEGWALKEISDHIEVPIEDLVNPPAARSSPTANKTKSTFLRPVSHHPHTSRIDTDSDIASSMRASVLTRNTRNTTLSSITSPNSRRGVGRTSTPQRGDGASIASSAKSTATFESAGSGSTVRRSVAIRRRGTEDSSPAKRIVASVRARDVVERPDSKLTLESIGGKTPSIVESQFDEDDEYLEDMEDRESVFGEDEGKHDSGEEQAVADNNDAANSKTPVKKMVITKASLTSIKGAAAAAGRVKSSGPSLRSVNSSSNSTTSQSIRKSFNGSASNLSVSTRNLGPRPSSRGSTVTTNTMQSRTTMSTNTASSRSTLSSLHSRPVSRSSVASSLSTSSLAVGGETRRSGSSVSGTTESSFKTASSGGRTPVDGGASVAAAGSRTRRTSAASTISVKSTGTARTSPVNARQRKVSTGSVSSVKSPAGQKKGVVPPPVPAIDTKKLGVKAPSVRSVVSVGGVRRVVAERKSVGGLRAKAKVGGALQKEKEKEQDVKEKEEQDVKEKKEQDVEEKEEQDVDVAVETSSVLSTGVLESPQHTTEHRKTTSSTSTSSVATVKRRGSVDTITTVRTKGSGSSQGSCHPTKSSFPAKNSSPPLPPVPFEDGSVNARRQRVEEEDEDEDKDNGEGDTTVHLFVTPRGATLDIGIPCIISSKRKRFKAYARYIGEVEGEEGPWVGVEVPMPVIGGGGGDVWGDRSAVYSSMSMNSNNSLWPDDDRQWNDGSWGGIRYFEIRGGGGVVEDRVSRRRRRVDGGSAGAGAVWGSAPPLMSVNGSLKRDPTELSISLERMMKRVRSASPAGSDTSSNSSSSMMESRGLFVRPRQVLYVVDAVGADL